MAENTFVILGNVLKRFQEGVTIKAPANDLEPLTGHPPSIAHDETALADGIPFLAKDEQSLA